MIYSEDQGTYREMTDQLLQTPKIEAYIRLNQAESREEVIEAIKAGSEDYGLVIPHEFSSNVMTGESAEWEFIRGNDRMNNMIAESVLQSIISQIHMMQSSAIVLGETSLQLVSEHTQSNQSHVEVGRLSSSSKEFTATEYYASAMLIMFLLYSGLASATSLVMEKQDHTLSRLSSMPIHAYQIVFGKLLGGGILAGFQATVIILGTSLLYGVNWGTQIHLVIALCLLVILCSMSIAIITTLLFKTLQAVTVAFPVIIITMTALSGGFSPDLGSFVNQLGKFTISHWGSDGLLQMMLYNESAAITNHLLILSVTGFSLLALFMLLYRKVGYHE